MATIACKIPNGIILQLRTEGFDDGTGDGVKTQVRDGPAVRLNGPSVLHTGTAATTRDDMLPALTEVDGEWWAKWLKQNKLNSAVTGGYIFEMQEEPAPEAGPIPPA